MEHTCEIEVIPQNDKAKSKVHRAVVRYDNGAEFRFDYKGSYQNVEEIPDHQISAWASLLSGRMMHALILRERGILALEMQLKGAGHRPYLIPHIEKINSKLRNFTKVAPRSLSDIKLVNSSMFDSVHGSLHDNILDGIKNICDLQKVDQYLVYQQIFSEDFVEQMLKGKEHREENGIKKTVNSSWRSLKSIPTRLPMIHKYDFMTKEPRREDLYPYAMGLKGYDVKIQGAYKVSHKAGKQITHDEDEDQLRSAFEKKLDMNSKKIGHFRKAVLPNLSSEEREIAEKRLTRAEAFITREREAFQSRMLSIEAEADLSAIEAHLGINEP